MAENMKVYTDITFNYSNKNDGTAYIRIIGRYEPLVSFPYYSVVCDLGNGFFMFDIDETKKGYIIQTREKLYDLEGFATLGRSNIEDPKTGIIFHEYEKFAPGSFEYNHFKLAYKEVEDVYKMKESLGIKDNDLQEGLAPNAYKMLVKEAK